MEIGRLKNMVVVIRRLGGKSNTAAGPEGEAGWVCALRKTFSCRTALTLILRLAQDKPLSYWERGKVLLSSTHPQFLRLQFILSS